MKVAHGLRRTLRGGVFVLDAVEQLRLLRRGVEQIVREEELLQKLERSVRTGIPLRVKYGIDPTGVDVHLGHTVPLRKLRQFQNLGHLPVIIIGDYTALIGDPSGRDEARARLDEATVQRNAQDYLYQIGKIVDLSRAEVHRNSHWFSTMSFRQVIELCSHMTVARLLEREDFSQRLQKGTPIYLHECLYPLMQGWDSVMVRADVELGGSEQLFSLLVGRDLQRAYGQEPQVAMTLPILVGTDGVRRMGKSLGNYIGIAEPPDAMFGKLMSIPDACLRSYFELLTDLSPEEIDRWLSEEVNPRDAKAFLGKQIVGYYYGTEEAERAALEFDRRFRDKEDPTVIPEVPVSQALLDGGSVWICRLLVLLGLAPSTSEARRLIEQGAVRLGDAKERILDPHAQVAVVDGLVVRVGKRRIARIRLVP
jgi:tyrosyl-tRNA synthetase